MSELVKTLREIQRDGAWMAEKPKWPHPVCTQAADRIEKLEAALREIADHSPGVTHGWAEHVRHIARTTLSP